VPDVLRDVSLIEAADDTIEGGGGYNSKYICTKYPSPARTRTTTRSSLPAGS